MDFHFASAWERVADAVPEVDAVVMGEQRWTWAAFDRLRGPYAHFHRLLRRSGWFSGREHVGFALRYHLRSARSLPSRPGRRWPSALSRRGER